MVVKLKRWCQKFIKIACAYTVPTEPAVPYLDTIT